MGAVWGDLGGYLEGIWRVFVVYLEGIWRVAFTVDSFDFFPFPGLGWLAFSFFLHRTDLKSLSIAFLIESDTFGHNFGVCDPLGPTNGPLGDPLSQCACVLTTVHTYYYCCYYNHYCPVLNAVGVNHASDYHAIWQCMLPMATITFAQSALPIAWSTTIHHSNTVGSNLRLSPKLTAK